MEEWLRHVPLIGELIASGLVGFAIAKHFDASLRKRKRTKLLRRGFYFQPAQQGVHERLTIDGCEYLIASKTDDVWYVNDTEEGDPDKGLRNAELYISEARSVILMAHIMTPR
jgi:hypothetical protein